MRKPRRILRPLAVALYAAFVGLLLASYVAPLQQVFQARSDIPALEEKISHTEAENARQRRLAGELKEPAGIERAARERYGMVLPGEKVYIVSNDGR